MRDYGKVLPTFWTRGSGKALRGHPEAQVIALYLFTCPASNMIGIYHVALPTIAHETGLTIEGASNGLARASEAGIVHYDEAEELVYLPEGARIQLGETLSRGDKRVKGVERELDQFRGHRFHTLFLERYAAKYSLKTQAPSKPLPSPLQGASKPLRSQEQEQEQEQEQDPNRTSAGAGKDSDGSEASGSGAGDAVGPEPEPEDANTRAVLAILRSHPVLVDAATARVAEDIAAQMGFDGKPLRTIERAIGDVADKARAADLVNRPIGTEAIVGMLVSFARNGIVKPGDKRAKVSATEAFLRRWSASYRQRVGLDYARTDEDADHVARVLGMAADAARDHDGKATSDEIVAHWVRSYLADEGEAGFVAKANWPLRYLPRRVSSYGLPPRPSAPRAPREEAPAPPAIDSAEAARLAAEAMASLKVKGMPTPRRVA